jgi:hypothetical protein
MREDFEEWAKGKIALVASHNKYNNLEAQIAWEAWQRAWNIAVREQRRKDENEINALKHKVNSAMAVLGTKTR